MEDFFGEPKRTSSDIADYIMKNFHIVTTDLGMYLYDEYRGVYTLDYVMVPLIYTLSKNPIHHFLAETLNIIRHRTYSPDVTSSRERIRGLSEWLMPLV
ncbi:MAG: hypothetical protein QW393_04755 [Candidatus Micrarchaeaceae archaeon]